MDNALGSLRMLEIFFILRGIRRMVAGSGRGDSSGEVNGSEKDIRRECGMRERLLG